jgi:serine/threonine protein kinase
MMSMASGTLIGRYVVERQLGRGGMGLVLLARDRELDRMVAIKLIQSDATGESDRQRARMRREARALAKIEHENIAQIYDTSIQDGQSYIVMQYIAGPNMAEWLTAKRRSTHEILSAFLAAARGLAAVHQHGLAHRDFKPANVIITGDGNDMRVKVVDFGLVCQDTDDGNESHRSPSTPLMRTWDRPLTLTGGWAGTLAYMAPERFYDQPKTMSLADQFSFCVSLYEALFDKRPFDLDPDERAKLTAAEAQLATMRRIASSPPHPVELRGDRKISRAVMRMIMRGLQKNPEYRYASMTRLVWILQRAVNRARWVTVGVGLGLVLLALCVLLLLDRIQDSQDETRERGSLLETPGEIPSR